MGPESRSVAFDARKENTHDRDRHRGRPRSTGATHRAADCVGALTAITEAIADGVRRPHQPAGAGPETVSAGRRPSRSTSRRPTASTASPAAHSFIDDLRAAQHGDARPGSGSRRSCEELGRSRSPPQHRRPQPGRRTGPTSTCRTCSSRRPLWDLGLHRRHRRQDRRSPSRSSPRPPAWSAPTPRAPSRPRARSPPPSQTVTPTAVSGKIEINREVWDQGGTPQADAIIWGEMLNGWYEALEAKIATRLATVGTAELNLACAVDAALVNGADRLLRRPAVRPRRQPLHRASPPTATCSRRWSARPTPPAARCCRSLGPTNAQGTTAGGFDRVQLGNQTDPRRVGARHRPTPEVLQLRAVLGVGLGLDPEAVHLRVPGQVASTWRSGATRASAVLRDSDVKPIDYTTADA